MNTSGTQLNYINQLNFVLRMVHACEYWLEPKNEKRK